MTVSVEPLAIGTADGPRVWLCVRRAGGHLDVEEMPEAVSSVGEAVGWAAQRWNVPASAVVVRPVEVVSLGE